MISRIFRFLLVFSISWLTGHWSADACTIWGAAGSAVQGNGTLVAKNRDWEPDHRQQLHIVRPKKGYSSIVLKAVGGHEPGTKAGINEKGLVIVSATAGQIPAKARDGYAQISGLIPHLLAECATVDEVLKKLDLFHRPAFYLVGDRREIAVIEILPDSRKQVERTSSGALKHTNHYFIATDSGTDRQPKPSSLTRLARIDALLKSKTPFTLDNFINFSKDQNDGPDNSIWRIGSDPKKTRSLATWLVSVPRSGSPQLYVKTADPGDSEHVCRVSVDQALKKSFHSYIAFDSDLCHGFSPPKG